MGKPTLPTIAEHFRMHAAHGARAGVTPDRMVAWAEKTGREVRVALGEALGEELGEAMAVAVAEGLVGAPLGGGGAPADALPLGDVLDEGDDFTG